MLGFVVVYNMGVPKDFYMSTLSNESLYETCFDESFEEYMRISGLSSADLDKWIKVNPFVLDWIENMAWKKFQSMSS